MGAGIALGGDAAPAGPREGTAPERALDPRARRGGPGRRPDGWVPGDTPRSQGRPAPGSGPQPPGAGPPQRAEGSEEAAIVILDRRRERVVERAQVVRADRGDLAQERPR